ncbi:MAG TPA: DUF1801 domain-containing protein [Bacteroidia bacterium]|jgi:uncharacterized protein YdeI (YjbR/CyaY-like superfamily)|nr:DUF1801 domain-containing protein [Bacteroidia bacterium]
MAKTKHNPIAHELITGYIKSLPPWSKKICEKLRNVILKSDPHLIEDWKWGPNYYSNGMVCGYVAHQKFVNFVFFQGALLKDQKKILLKNTGTLHNRHLRYTDVAQVDEDVLLTYLFEAIDNNKKGKKLIQAKDKTVVIPTKVKKQFTTHGVLKLFESMNYARKKELLLWISYAKREETKQKRIGRVIELVKKKMSLVDLYKK